MTLFGWYRLMNDIEERNYRNLAKFNAKFERAYALQAQENVRWLQREKEFLDAERKLMAGHADWVVGKRRYYTQFEDRPDTDALDSRKIGAW